MRFLTLGNAMLQKKAQLQMCTRLIIIGKIRGQNLPQIPLTEGKDVIQSVAPKRSDEAFSAWILPITPAGVPLGHSVV